MPQEGGHDPSSIDSQFVHIVWNMFQASDPVAVQPHRNSIKVMPGRTLIVKCKAKGKPDPEIIWLRNQRPLVLSGNVKVDRSRASHEDKQQLTSTLQISRISAKDSGNYTCRAKNNHGSIQKWVHVDIRQPPPTKPPIASGPQRARCPPMYCLNNGTCHMRGMIPLCNCTQPYHGHRCAQNPTAYHNFSEACREKVLDCFHRTDRILTATGIGLVITMFLLIMLISCYLSRQRRREFDFWRRAKRANSACQCMQAGHSSMMRQQQRRTVGTDAARDLFVIDSADSNSYDAIGSCSSQQLQHQQQLLLLQSLTFPTRDLTPSASCHGDGEESSEAGDAVGDAATMGASGWRRSPEQAAFFYRPLRSCQQQLQSEAAAFF